MFVVTLIVEKTVVTSKTILRIKIIKATMVNFMEITMIRTMIMTTGKALAMN